MFFPRLRKQAKWMFILLALVFAVGFVGFGVGSGSTGIGDLFQNGKFFGLGGNGSSSAGTSVGKAQKEIAQNPGKPKGYRDLASAYEAKSQNDLAVAPLEKYTQLRPKDQDALRELANLYLGQVDRYRTVAQAAQQNDATALAGPLFQPAATSPIGKALGSDSIQSAVSERVNTAVQDNAAKAQVAQQSAIAAYKRLVAAAPSDPTARFQLAQAAESVGDYTTAIAAYKQVIKLEPDSNEIPSLKQHIKQLQSAQAGSSATSG